MFQFELVIKLINIKTKAMFKIFSATTFHYSRIKYSLHSDFCLFDIFTFKINNIHLEIGIKINIITV